MKHYFIYILFLLAATSCGLSEEPEIVGGEGDVDLSFTLEIPEATDQHVGLKLYDENSVSSIDLLVFDQTNKFLQRIKVNNISGTGPTKSFSVRMPVVNQARTFHIVANGRNANGEDVVNFGSIALNALESQAIPSLKTNTLAANTAPLLPLVMWGRATLPAIAAGASIGTPGNPTKMLRSSAAMLVECAAPTGGNGLQYFKLKGFTVLQSSNMGRVAPAAYTQAAATPTTVSLIAGSSNINYATSSTTGVWATGTDIKTSELYLYERTNVLDNTGLSVIIRGVYEEVEGYYKVWLVNPSGSVLHIVRNHRYHIQIAKVWGAGYPTFEQAMNAGHSANITVGIIDENYDITDMVVDGKYELGVSSNDVSFISRAGTYPVATIFNTNSEIPTPTATTNVGWITNITLTPSGARRTTMAATVTATTVLRTGYITVRVGSLERRIKVTQRP